MLVKLILNLFEKSMKKLMMNFLLQAMFSITCVDDLLNRSFYKLGYIVGRTPGYFIVIPILLGCICITGFQRIHHEIDPEYLFSPVNGPGKTERAIVEQYFKVNYSHRFNVARITRPGRFFFSIRVSILKIFNIFLC